MLVKETMERNIFEFVDIESLVPKNHILRKIDTAIDFSKIYEIVGNLYCQDNGRPGIDPVILFKIVLIQHIFGIPSLRRTLEEVNLNIAYRQQQVSLTQKQFLSTARISKPMLI